MANVLDLVGLELDVAVAKLEGRTVVQDPMKFNDGSWWIWEMMPHENGGTDIHTSTMAKIGDEYSPSTNWNHGGAIIERERIELQPLDLQPLNDNGWTAIYKGVIAVGGTALTAAMRAYVLSKTGTEQ